VGEWADLRALASLKRNERESKSSGGRHNKPSGLHRQHRFTPGAKNARQGWLV
jgi:hypothetical protein